MINNEEYPVFTNKKALQPCGEDGRTLGVCQSVYNVNLPALMQTDASEDAVPFRCEDRDYFFNHKKVEEIDKVMREQKKLGVTVTLILLNAPRLFDSRQEKQLLDICIHPDYVWNAPEAFISAFSYYTEGRYYYQAFVEFLASRYAGGSEELSCVRGMIVSNEIDSQYIWGNAGEKTVEEYMREYTEILRLTLKAGRKYYSHMRVYISLDHMFNCTQDGDYPKRYYKGRDVLELLNHYAKEGGDFEWSVAYHCYPENLFYPDFYNDRAADFYFSTPKITFKNIEMLPAYLNQERFLYHGRKRHIILSEEGFNGGNDKFLEEQGAAAYNLAYRKIQAIPEIDMFMVHSYTDNPHEFGLKLGIRRTNPDGTPGNPKRIYECMKDMGTPAEEKWNAWAESFVGQELYHRVLYPEIHMEEQKDNSLEFNN